MATPHARRRRGGFCATLLTTLLLGFGTVAAPASGQEGPAPMPGTTPVAGATIVGQRWLTQRTLELTVSTPSFIEPVQVEIVLPTGYSADASRRWPSTYYLNGTNGNQTWFRTVYAGEALTASYPSIVVVPSGHAGYWSDWYNGGVGGPPMYETFVTEQLIPLVDANFRTMPVRAQRAVIGESMGGYGAMMLAARHPDLFTAVSSLSGAPDTNWLFGAAALSISSTIDLAPPDSIYGPRATQEVRWRGHNPTDLAANLGSLDVQLYTGNGVLGEQEKDPVTPAFCAVEAGVIEPETRSAHLALVGLGIPHLFKVYDWGCHSPELIQQEIADSLPRFAQLFTQDGPLPAQFDYRSIEPRFDVFGWTVLADPSRALEFLDLHDVSSAGFTITGSGSTRVTTPPLFRGAAPVMVLVNGVATRVTPDRAGRLAIDVDLGPADRDQQYTLGAVTNRQSAVVRFARP